MDETQRSRIRPERRKRRSMLPATLAVLVLLVVCGVAAGLLWAGWQLPRVMIERFGAADPALSDRQRMITSLRLLVNQRDLTEPVNAQGQPVDFKVLLGESVPTITGRLEQQELVRDADALRDYLIYSGLDKGIQAGEYRLSPALNAMQIAQALQDATPAEVTFTILPGWRAEEIAGALPTSGLSIQPEDFLALVRNPEPLNHPLTVYGTLEGFLYPGVYRVERTISLEDLLTLFLNRFAENVDASLREALDARGFDLFEAVTLASLVQREAIVAEEQPMIASVFNNRLNSAMKLDSDPTVQYAVGFNDMQQTWWTNPLSVADLQTVSPYNTYIQTGLPPGPICSPTRSALQAVAYPANTPYYYFRARCDGSSRHAFARSYEEHLQNACE